MMNDVTMAMVNYLARLLVMLFGALIAYLQPIVPVSVIFLGFVALDIISAIRLSMRAKRLGLSSQGKIQSHKIGKAIGTVFMGFALIVLMYHTQVHILTVNVYLHNVIALGLCGWQFLSILENESSCNGAGWAVFVQKYVIDKTSRHLGFDVGKAYKEAKEQTEGYPEGAKSK